MIYRVINNFYGGYFNVFELMEHIIKVYGSWLWRCLF